MFFCSNLDVKIKNPNKSESRLNFLAILPFRSNSHWQNRCRWIMKRRANFNVIAKNTFFFGFVILLSLVRRCLLLFLFSSPVTRYHFILRTKLIVLDF